ncbi:hypothetical protein ACFQX4_16505 [Roseomonas sp. GCM10028921]
MLPWLAPEGGRDIALAVPVFEMGGVACVVTNLAAVLRERGWRPHLVVTGADAATLPPGALAAFETVQFPQRGGIEGSDSEAGQLGAPLPGATSLRDALGQLAPMEAVHAAAGALRGLGVLTIAGLHVVSATRPGRPWGTRTRSLPVRQAMMR